MKTILLLTAFVLTAFTGYGQTDSVTISLEKANRIEQQLRACDLAAAELRAVRLAELQQRMKLLALSGQNVLLHENIADLKTYNASLEKKITKLTRYNKWQKIGLVAAAVFGFVIGSR